MQQNQELQIYEKSVSLSKINYLCNQILDKRTFIAFSSTTKRKKMKRKVFGALLLMEALFLLLSTLVALCYKEGDLLPLALTTTACTLCGAALYFPQWQKKGNLKRKDCYIIISGAWVIFSLFGMLPFLLYGTTDSVTDAFFETMSGFTTTGASVLNNIDSQPHGILFWRSILQWMGGLGIVIFSIALLPSFSKNDKQLFSTEACSVSTSKLRSKTQETARGIFIIYIALTLLCGFFYYVGPMNLFDSICHAMTTIGTGGFSTHQASIAHFNSPYIEYVCSIFCIMAGVNFALYFFASTGNWQPLKTNEELRWYTCGLIILVLFFFLLFIFNPNNCVSIQMPQTIEEKFRTALFHVANICTSCGFQSTFCDYDGWGSSFWMPTLSLMIIGACAGSSSGGLKIVRFIVCMKNMRNEFLLHQHPNAVFPVKISKHVVDPVMVKRTLAFIFMYLLLITVGTFALSITGLSFDTSFGSCLSALGNTGPGFGQTGPIANYATISDAAKWILSALMLIGRLEVYAILLMLTPSFWKD